MSLDLTPVEPVLLWPPCPTGSADTGLGFLLSDAQLGYP